MLDRCAATLPVWRLLAGSPVLLLLQIGCWLREGAVLRCDGAPAHPPGGGGALKQDNCHSAALLLSATGITTVCLSVCPSSTSVGHQGAPAAAAPVFSGSSCVSWSQNVPWLHREGRPHSEVIVSDSQPYYPSPPATPPWWSWPVFRVFFLRTATGESERRPRSRSKQESQSSVVEEMLDLCAEVLPEFACD